MANAQALYAQARVAIEDGDRKEGERLLRQALREDRDYLDAWVALSEIQNGRQKERSLNEVLRLDPKNAYARQALEDEQREETTLDDLFGRTAVNIPVPREEDLEPPPEKPKPKRSNRPLAVRKDELIPGVKRRWALLAAVILPIYTILIGVFSVGLVTSTQQAREAESATFTAIAQGQVDVANTELALNNQATATEQAINATATGVILAQATAERAITLTAFVQVTPTLTPTLPFVVEETSEFEGVPPPPDIPGRLYAWGGFSATSDEFLPLRVYNPAAQNDSQLLAEEFGIQPRVDLAASRMLFTLEDLRVNETLIAQFNPNDPNASSSTFGGELKVNVLRDQRDPYVTVNGTSFAFIADDDQTGGVEIYRYDLDSQKLVAVTQDVIPYTSVALSPDATQLYAVKSDGTGTDVVLIQLPTLQEIADDPDIELVPDEYLQIRLTFDGNDLVEDNLYLSPDGSRLLFSAHATGDEGNSDIYVLDVASDEAQVPQPLIQTPADEVHPVFSPDGNYVAYASNVNGEYNLFIYDIANDISYQITDDLDDPTFPGSWAN